MTGRRDERLTGDDLVAIATSLGPRVAHFLADVPGLASSQLAESFPVHLAGSIDLAETARIRRIGKRAPFAGYWHHQIRVGDTAVLCAYSRRAEDGWDGFNVFGQALAPLVDAAIAWTDAHLIEARRPRMLMIPEAYVFALWLQVGRVDRIVLVSAGDRYGLDTARAYTPHRFFKTVFAASSRSAPASDEAAH